MRYELYETEKAEKNRKKLEKKDAHIKDNIKKVYERLSQDPYSGTMFLTGTFRGKRKIRFMGKKLRITFAICEECRRLGHKGFNNCVDCEHIPDNAVKIFGVFFRGRGY